MNDHQQRQQQQHKQELLVWSLISVNWLQANPLSSINAPGWAPNNDY